MKWLRESTLFEKVFVGFSFLGLLVSCAVVGLRIYGAIKYANTPEYMVPHWVKVIEGDS